VPLASTKLRLSEYGAEALRHVGVRIKYFNIYVCASVGMNNKQYIMHGMYIKIVEAQPARMYNIYENIKLKLLKTKVAIWYNK
jgi:hypothetical protein